MSRTFAPRLLAVILLAGALACAPRAWAAVASLQDLTAQVLVPSAAPPLLGPITAVGRKGWDCKPERAAQAKSARDAELPRVGEAH